VGAFEFGFAIDILRFLMMFKPITDSILPAIGQTKTLVLNE